MVGTSDRGRVVGEVDAVVVFVFAVVAVVVVAAARAARARGMAETHVFFVLVLFSWWFEFETRYVDWSVRFYRLWSLAVSFALRRDGDYGIET